MGRNGNNCNDRSKFLAGDFIGIIVPEDTVSARGIILLVGFEDFLAIQACQ
jgi:hypothetical protein